MKLITEIVQIVHKRKFSGSAIYKVTCKNEWKESYPIKEVKKNKFKSHCIPCGKDLSCSPQGLKDVKDHCSKPSLLQAHSSVKKQSRLPSSFTGEKTSKQQKGLYAEVMVSNITVQHNLSISAADHLGQLFKNIFPDSQIASSYACSKTKTFCIINKAFQPYYHKQTIDYCKNHPFTVGHDCSNDTGVQKMNPIAVRIFDINQSKTVSEYFYSMCLTDGENAGRAYNNFEKIDSIFQSDEIPWQNCAILSVDTTKAMVGRRNSVGSRFLEKNPNFFIGGCSCYLAHIAASNTNDAFSKCIGLNVEDVCVDCYYWFDKGKT